MATLEETLRDKTHKGQVENDGRRVLYTIMTDRVTKPGVEKAKLLRIV